MTQEEILSTPGLKTLSEEEYYCIFQDSPDGGFDFIGRNALVTISTHAITAGVRRQSRASLVRAAAKSAAAAIAVSTPARLIIAFPNDADCWNQLFSIWSDGADPQYCRRVHPEISDLAFPVQAPFRILAPRQGPMDTAEAANSISLSEFVRIWRSDQYQGDNADRTTPNCRDAGDELVAVLNHPGKEPFAFILFENNAARARGSPWQEGTGIPAGYYRWGNCQTPARRTLGGIESVRRERLHSLLFWLNPLEPIPPPSAYDYVFAAVAEGPQPPAADRIERLRKCIEEFRASCRSIQLRGLAAVGSIPDRLAEILGSLARCRRGAPSASFTDTIASIRYAAIHLSYEILRSQALDRAKWARSRSKPKQVPPATLMKALALDSGKSATQLRRAVPRAYRLLTMGDDRFVTDTCAAPSSSTSNGPGRIDAGDPTSSEEKDSAHVQAQACNALHASDEDQASATRFDESEDAARYEEPERYLELSRLIEDGSIDFGHTGLAEPL